MSGGSDFLHDSRSSMIFIKDASDRVQEIVEARAVLGKHILDFYGYIFFSLESISSGFSQHLNFFSAKSSAYDICW